MSQQISYLGETYTGARATPDLVGRGEILPAIDKVIHQTTATSVIYLTGAGGVGKTKLIRHILTTIQAGADLLAARDLIDLYHTRNRSVGGLAQSIVDVLQPLRDYIRSRPIDSEIDEKLDALARAEQEGLSSVEVTGRRQELSALLLEVINEFSQKRRLVLALDTAERLYVVRDEAQERLGLATERPAVLEWLLHDFLPNLANATVIIAGRPEPLNLTNDLQARTADAQQTFLPIQLGGLTEAEAMAYFAAIVANTRTSTRLSDQMIATTIERWSDAEKRTLFYCLHDGGAEPRIRPILLALAIDHLAVAGYPLPALTRPLAEAQMLQEADRRRIEVELGQTLVRTLREHHRPADDAIIMLGWLRKGADIDLLQRLTGNKDRARIIQIVEDLRDLSFVKVRQTENAVDYRIFLHDEMYDILQRYALERPSPGESRRIFSVIESYYAEAIAAARLRIDQLYHPQADKPTEILPDPNAVRETRARLHDAIVEDLYYRLHWRPIDAFQQYALYAEEAILSNDDTLWAMLRAELFGFLAEGSTSFAREEIEELRIHYVVPDSAVRWVAWLWSKERFTDALATAEKPETEQLVQSGGELVKNYWLAWRGLLNVPAGNYDQAESLLQRATEGLVNWSNKNQRTKYWANVLAFTFNALGFLYNNLTKHYQAIGAYAKAAQLWGDLNLVIWEGNTLNNRAYDLAKIGDFAAALPAAKAALSKREQLGQRSPVGLSLNTLGLIELAQFDLEGGLRDIRRAVEIFRKLESLRGLGLALIALTEAERRISVSVVYVQQGRSADILADAVRHGIDAITIFRDRIQEKNSHVLAVRELARTYRDWAKLRHEYPTIFAKQKPGVEPPVAERWSVEELAALSHKTFEAAKALIGDDDSTEIELLYDEALLIYYTQLYVGAHDYEQVQTKLEENFLQKIDRLIPSEFSSTPPAAPPKERVWSLVQRANVELLRGHLAFNQWAAHPQNEQPLYRAVEHYTFALTYYAYFSKHIFPERRQGLDDLYDQLLPLSTKQKRQVHEIVHQLEHDHGLATHASAMSEFLHERFGELDDFTLEF